MLNGNEESNDIYMMNMEKYLSNIKDFIHRILKRYKLYAIIDIIKNMKKQNKSVM